MSLYMLYLPIRPRALLACGREHGLVRDTAAVDLGYLVHALLARALGDDAPRPFDVQAAPADDRHPGARPGAADALQVLAYGGSDAGTLRQRAAQCGDASAQAAIAWDEVRSKPMPGFAAGRRLGFRVRLCPTLRVGKRHPCFAPGAEIDPYLALVARGAAERAAARPGAGDAILTREAAAAAPTRDQVEAAPTRDLVEAAPTREAVYRDWLADRIGLAATVVQARLVSVRDARLWRRGTPGDGAAATMHGHARPRLGGRVAIGRREAVFEGTLEVRDEALFQALLARGVGRHRAFGFGMLLLRAANVD